MTFHDIDLYLSCQEVADVDTAIQEIAIQAKFLRCRYKSAYYTIYINVNTLYYNSCMFQEDRWFPSISTEVAPHRTNSQYGFTFDCPKERTNESSDGQHVMAK
jgi:hypothetical protein